MLPKTQALCRVRKLARQLSGWRCLPSGLTTRVLPPEQTWWRREPVLNSCPQASTHAPWPVHAHRLAHDYINKCNMKMVVGLFLMCRVKLRPGFGFPTLCPIPCATAAAKLRRNAPGGWISSLPPRCSAQSLPKYGMKAHSEPSLPDNSQLKCQGKETLPPSPLPSSHPQQHSPIQAVRFFLQKAFGTHMGRREAHAAWIFMTVTAPELLD